MTSSTARPILERLAYVCYLGLLAGSIGVAWIGGMVAIETGDFTAMWVALGGLALSRWLHVHGHARWHFRDCEGSLQLTGNSGLMPRSDGEQILLAEITALFARLEAEDDVWARSEYRRTIAAHLATAPALRAEFTEALAAHPEL